MAFIQINGAWVKSPAELTYDIEDLDASGFRTTDGRMHRERIGKKMKLGITWNEQANPADFHSLYRLLDNLPEFFTVTFPYPDGTTATKTMYRGNPLSTSMRSYLSENGNNVARYSTLKVSLIER